MKVKLNDVHKKHLKILGWLIGSWALALGLAYVLKNPYLAGLAPVFNYLGYAIKLELEKSGYIESLKILQYLIQMFYLKK